MEISEGDRILAIDNWPINNGIDYYLSELVSGTNEVTQASIPLKIFSSKNNKEMTFSVPLSNNLIACEKSTPPLEHGCSFSIFQQNSNEPTLLASGWTKSLNISSTDRKHSVEFQGYLRIPEEGSYSFFLDVNGTGMFSLGNSFVIEKNIPHPRMRVMKRGYFSKGDHKLTLNLELSERPGSVFPKGVKNGIAF